MKLLEVTEQPITGEEYIKRNGGYQGGDLLLLDQNVKSFGNCQDMIITGDFSIAAARITSFEGCPRVIEQDFVTGYYFATYTGMHKHVKHVGGTIYCVVRPCLLPLVLIGGVQQITFTGAMPTYAFKLQEILNRHIGTHDIHNCQEELLEAGFKEYARL